MLRRSTLQDRDPLTPVRFATDPLRMGEGGAYAAATTITCTFGFLPQTDCTAPRTARSMAVDTASASRRLRTRQHCRTSAKTAPRRPPRPYPRRTCRASAGPRTPHRDRRQARRCLIDRRARWTQRRRSQSLTRSRTAPSSSPMTNVAVLVETPMSALADHARRARREPHNVAIARAETTCSNALRLGEGDMLTSDDALRHAPARRSRGRTHS